MKAFPVEMVRHSFIFGGRGCYLYSDVPGSFSKSFGSVSYNSNIYPIDPNHWSILILADIQVYFKATKDIWLRVEPKITAKVPPWRRMMRHIPMPVTTPLVLRHQCLPLVPPPGRSGDGFSACFERKLVAGRAWVATNGFLRAMYLLY